MSALDFSNKYHRRIFFVLMFLAFVVLIIVKSAIARLKMPVIDSVLDSLIVANVSSTAITLVLLVLTPQKEINAIQVLKPGSDLTQVLSQDVYASEYYWYKGTAAKFARSKILPELARRANEMRTRKEAYILILDPRDDEVCKQMAKLDRGENQNINIDQRVIDIRKDSLATILNAHTWNSSGNHLRVYLGLHKDISLFRYDLTDVSVISSRPSARDYALRFSRNGDFYGSFSLELKVLYEIFQFPLKDTKIDFAHLDGESARQLFSDLGLDLDNMGIQDKELGEIVKAAKEPENPYPD